MNCLVPIVGGFASGLILDYFWTRCVDAVQAGRPVVAANMSVLIYLCTLISTVLIVEQRVIACIAYAIGGWIGCYWAVRKVRRIDG